MRWVISESQLDHNESRKGGFLSPCLQQAITGPLHGRGGLNIPNFSRASMLGNKVRSAVGHSFDSKGITRIATGSPFPTSHEVEEGFSREQMSTYPACKRHGGTSHGHVQHFGIRRHVRGLPCPCQRSSTCSDSGLDAVLYSPSSLPIGHLLIYTRIVRHVQVS